jgi:hypothetical protein
MVGYTAHHLLPRVGAERGDRGAGRPSVIDDGQVVIATLQAPPESLGVTRRSARLLARSATLSACI